MKLSTTGEVVAAAGIATTAAIMSPSAIAVLAGIGSGAAVTWWLIRDLNVWDKVGAVLASVAAASGMMYAISAYMDLAGQPVEAKAGVALLCVVVSLPILTGVRNLADSAGKIMGERGAEALNAAIDLIKRWSGRNGSGSV